MNSVIFYSYNPRSTTQCHNQFCSAWLSYKKLSKKKTRSNTPCFRRTLPVCIKEQRLHMLIYDHLAERE